eukprot:NODE_2029_length_465_cov_4.209135_g1950_i0.p4 GENE.NODE_2029_length_465_cov_4.209135_g1950_i0~~NODE_2029_length_465_cov_4.209135_g1950_i0.p4  ORF type:complete len:51 (+),score=4.25 NODE_2029_length_465_cov_4.209135_g1950_i0:216-368(+)
MVGIPFRHAVGAEGVRVCDLPFLNHHPTTHIHTHVTRTHVRTYSHIHPER